MDCEKQNSSTAHYFYAYIRNCTKYCIHGKIILKFYFYEIQSRYINIIIRKSTKEILAESLQELAFTKSVEKITIKEITQNCGVTATTFYNHFADKYELLAWIYNSSIEPYFKKVGKTAYWNECIYQSSYILLNNQAFYRNALKNTTGQTSFRYQTNNYAIDLILAQIKEIHKFDEIPFDIRFQVKFYMRAISESINDWFLAGDNKQFPIEKFTDLLVKAMPKELSPYLPLIRK